MTPRKCAEFNCIDYAEAATLRSGPTIIATISGYSFRFGSAPAERRKKKKKKRQQRRAGGGFVESVAINVHFVP